MPWFKATANIEIEVEAPDITIAELGARNLLLKRVVGESFGHEENDRAEVKSSELINIQRVLVHFDDFAADVCPISGGEGTSDPALVDCDWCLQRLKMG